MLIIYRSNIYRCRNVPLGGRFVVPFGTALDIRTFLSSGSIWILDARVESDLSLRLYGKTIEFDNAGYIILVRHEHCDSLCNVLFVDQHQIRYN